MRAAGTCPGRPPCSNEEIAHRLFAALPTVKAHVARVLARLELRDRVPAVVFGHENGIIRPGG